MRITETHVYFWGGPLSQWYQRVMKLGEIYFITAEHYMMYHKAMLFGDEETALRILGANHPKAAKELGREVKNFVPSVWDENKLRIVFEGNVLKFTQHEDLKILLTNTYAGKTFVEASPKDRVWGVGLHYDDDRILNPAQWKGLNLLGRALNQVQTALL